MSLNSVEDFRVAFRMVAGLRVSQQLPKSSLSTSSIIFWGAPYVFSFRFSASGCGWHRFICSFCRASHTCRGDVVRHRGESVESPSSWKYLLLPVGVRIARNGEDVCDTCIVADDRV